MTAYETRTWSAVEVTIEEQHALPVAHTPEEDYSYGLGSAYGEEREAKNLPVFYYDIEQIEAGMDKVYGMSRVAAFTQDHTFPDGAEAKEGALVMFLTKYREDGNQFIFTILVETV